MDDGGKAIDDELFEEGAVGYRIAAGLNYEDFKVYEVLEFGDLEERHDIAFFELEDF